MWMLTTEYLRAGNSELSTDELLRLAGSRDRKVRCRVAENPSCTAELQALMMQDPSWEVRAALALNELVKLEILDILAKDLNPNVRLSLADNSRMPVRILEFLKHDDNLYVSEFAKRSLARKTMYAVSERKRAHSRGAPIRVSPCRQLNSVLS